MVQTPGSWTTSYRFSSATGLLEKGRKLKYGLLLGQEWQLELRINATNYTSEWTNVIHLTTGSNCCTYGTRNPSVFLYSDRINVETAHNGDLKTVSSTTHLPKLNVLTTIIIKQTLVGSQYVQQIYSNGALWSSVTNTRPSAFSNVMLYASGPWHPAHPGHVNYIDVRTKLGELQVPPLVTIMFSGKCEFLHTPCAHISGYDAYSLTKQTYLKCQETCCQDPLCKSFDFVNNGGCWFKYKKKSEVGRSYKAGCTAAGASYTEVIHSYSNNGV